MWNMAIPVLMGIGALGNAWGAMAGARSQRLNYELQAHLGEINAQIAERGGKSAILRGQRERQRSQLNTAQLKSRQRAAMAANGIALDSGAAVNLLTSTDVLGQIDADTIEASAIMDSWGYQTAALNARAGARGASATASGISPLGTFGSSLLGSAGQLASTWYYLNRGGSSSRPPSSGSGYGGGGG